MQAILNFTRWKRVHQIPATYLFIIVLIVSVQAVAEDESHEHAAANQHDQHKEHEGHDAPELKFSNAELAEFSIKLAQASSGEINKTLALTGEVIIAPERLYHIVPRVPGVVRKVFKHLGDQVNSGEILATLSSRELADAKAEYVAADSLMQLADANLKREQNLYKSKVTSRRKYLAAKQVHTEISIKRTAARQHLQAIGLTEQATRSILRNTSNDLTLYALTAPSAGVIIAKHAAQGELLDTTTRSFTVADLSQVWVNLMVYQKDLPYIRQGQQVLISTRFGLANQETIALSHISWLSPILDETTRSATARVVLDNSAGHWRPGLFVNGKVSIANTHAEIVISLSALQTIEGQTIVFVQHAVGEFEPQVVQVGHRDHQQVEILQGLTAGQTYVSENAFVLKAQSQKASFGHGHNH